MTTLTRLLVANRGEIACRIIRTAHATGLRTVAVYSPVDAHARHVRMADLAVPLVGTSAADTYLDSDQLLAAARLSGADAVHPGYGFLAENADFAQAVVDAGLVWVGPSPESVRLMGSKVAAKQAAAAAGVPLPPSHEVEGEDAGVWIAAGEHVGFPLLVKASAGGGGKGMRLVTGPDELAEAVRAARREAASAFGDPTVFLERYLAGARHVEVQVFGDTQGNVIHLGERECSIQRRHQKVIEETPSPGTTTETRERMLEAAVALARSVAYVGAGTVEFLVAGRGADQEVHFLEMNTRRQVEHPVTEAVTGLDLVDLQLRVAAGHPLGLTQAGVSFVGHAVEVRVYAEDPAAGHRPSTGRLARWDEAPGVRWDSGVEAEDEVSALYDPMLAKVVAHGRDRNEAIAVLARALRGSAIHGVATNLASLTAVLESPAFGAGDTPTDFLDRHPDLLAPAVPELLRRSHLVAAALNAAQERRSAASLLTFASPGWRNVRSAPQSVRFEVAGEETEVTYAFATLQTADVVVDGVASVATWTAHDGDVLDLEVGGLRALHVVTRVPGPGEADPVDVWVSGSGWTTRCLELPRFPVLADAAAAGGLTASLPGTVTAVMVEVGTAVAAGDLLVLLEAMKMEHRVTAVSAGVVTDVLVAPGDSVEAHQALVSVEPLGGSASQDGEE
ncbi:MAG TPA: biotin carboxylase N-terminal domain-containing protein [Candidatus Limnocylindria bacterium]|nr:biotin carboxylase N-terminal domain-containing protein [Candidatus Limnocylindria bacterium]